MISIGRRRSGDQAADHEQLLIILASEHGDIGLHEIEQLGHDGRDAGEMPRTQRAFERLADHRYLDAHACRRAEWIHFLDSGRKQQIAAACHQARLILDQRARVTREIFAGTKLGRIDEYTRHDTIRMSPRECNQGKMPIVQISHCGHEADARALAPPCGDARAQIRCVGPRRIHWLRTRVRDRGTRRCARHWRRHASPYRPNRYRRESPSRSAGGRLPRDAEHVVNHQHLTVAIGSGADADRRYAQRLRDALRKRRRHAFKDEQRGARVGDGVRIGDKFVRGGLAPTLDAIAAEAVNRLRREARGARKPAPGVGRARGITSST